MSDNESKLKLTCTSCQQVWSEKPHAPEISNNLRSSTVTLSHQTLYYCPNNKCRQAFVLMIQGVQLVLNAAPVGDDIVEKVEGSSIIKPGISLVQ